MTAPDHDAARWGATPPGYEATNTAEPAANQMSATPKLAADDLRDRIRDAVQCGCADADRTYAELERHFAEQLDAKDAEIKRLHVEVSRFQRAWEDAMADGDQQAVQRLSLRNQLNQERQRADKLSEILTSVWLYVSWRYVTKQLTAEQKELWADVIESTGDPNDRATVDRWWRDDQ